MFKLHKVGLLKEGDRFAFVSDAPRQVDGGGGMATGNLLVVTRTAQVNRAAESCFFRYREANDAANTNHSWNGNPEANVQLEVEGVDAPKAAPAADDDEKPEPARKRAASVKLVKQTSVAPEKPTAKATGKKKAPAKAAAAAKPAATKAAKGKSAKSVAEPAAAPSKTAKTVKPSQRLVMRSTSGSTAVSSRGAAEHSSSRAKRPAMTPQLKLKKSRRA